jgi:hypothetical protein
MSDLEDLSPPNVETVVSTGTDLTPPTEDKPKRGRKKKEAAPAAEGEAAAEAKPAKEKSARSNLSKMYPEDAVITVLAEKNPKKAGSAAASIFEFYRSGQTVGDFFAATAEHTFKDKKRPGTYADITYDVGHGYIKVG